MSAEPIPTEPRDAEPEGHFELEGRCVRMRGSNGGAELAGRLLASPCVRSVTFDHQRDEATVHLRSDQTGDTAGETLATIAALAGRQQTAMSRAAGRLEAAEGIVCWLDSSSGVDSYFRAPKMATGWKRALYLTGAAVTFALAVLGAILPGVPTTPFLLLTSYCLLRSSRKLHNRLLRSRILGGLLRDWHTHRGVRPGVKTKSLAVMALVVGATVLLSGLPPRALIGIVACSMIGVACICRLRVIR